MAKWRCTCGRWEGRYRDEKVHWHNAESEVSVKEGFCSECKDWLHPNGDTTQMVSLPMLKRWAKEYDRKELADFLETL